MPKHVEVMKGYTTVYVLCALFGSVTEDKLTKMRGVSNFIVHHIQVCANDDLSKCLWYLFVQSEQPSLRAGQR